MHTFIPEIYVGTESWRLPVQYAVEEFALSKFTLV